MKKVWLILIGLLPFLLGYMLNQYMMAHSYVVALPFGVIGFIVLAAWFLLGMRIYPLGNSAKQAAMFAHIPAFAVLLILLFQEIVLGHYWMNPIGLATQLFYLPLVNLVARITFFSPYMSVVYIVAFLLMYGVFYLGCRLRKKHMRRKSPIA